MENKTILVIEDNDLNMKLFRALLEVSNNRILEAPDAERGMEILRQEKPDLILMDIQLPGVDGYTATQKIKSDARLKDIPVLALTAYAMHGDREKALRAGCDGYISKPIDTRTFIENVERCLVSQSGTKTGRWEQPPLLKRKILLVDDEPISHRMLKVMLPDDRFEISTAVDGEECIAKAYSLQPDVILLDVKMPGLDGFEVSRRLKSDPKVNSIPIILVTALDGAENRVNGLEAGAEEFLTKPLRPAELLARISSMLQLKDYRDQLEIRRQCEKNFAEEGRKRPKAAAGLSEEIPTVLLVEDDEKVACLLQGFLKDEPLRILVIPTGTQALEHVLKHRVDLILLDLLLPDINGFEVCQRLRAMERHKDTPIIAITCLDDLESRIKGIEAGINDYLVKPINERELRARAKMLLEKKRQMDELRSHCETALNSAIIDWLTGLYNHGYLKKILRLEIKRSKRHGYPLNFLMLDVDDFKQYNDTYGHSVGDVILRHLGQCIRNAVREVDLVARYGGDEFAIVLPYADQSGAVKAAERIRDAVKKLDLSKTKAAGLNNITFSIGIASYSPEARDEDALIKTADQMMYLAKQKGKDRICFVEEEQDGKGFLPVSQG